jgi:predicted dehydrogenase
MDAIKSLHEGLIGDIYMARALCYKPRDSFGIARDTTPPATFHYDQWLGPAPYRPYNVKRSHYCWHWYWDTGNGDTGNTGPHQLDLARWGLKKNVHPVSVFSDGGLFGFHQDDKTLETSTPGNMVYGDVETYGMDKTSQETPNTQTATFKYEDGKLLEFEARGRFTNHEGSDGNEASNLYYGTEGWMEITGRTWRAFRNREKEAFATYDAKGIRGEGNLWSNFLDAVRSGKDETLRCGIDEGHLSSALPHLANISYRVGRSLKFMAGKEQFVNDPEANGFLSRDYRKPFVVPAIV